MGKLYTNAFSKWSCLSQLEEKLLLKVFKLTKVCDNVPIDLSPTLMESNYSAFCDILWIYSDFCLAKAHFEPDSIGKKVETCRLGTLNASNRPETVETGLIQRSLPYKRVNIYIEEFWWVKFGKKPLNFEIKGQFPYKSP